ncbi:MAG: glycoside hydrolase family 38 N-terminal domain-containing protein [Pirellulaceae bacterium]
MQRALHFLTCQLTWLLLLVAVANSSRSVDAADPSGQLDQVILVFKTHFDIGYTDMAKNVVERYRTSMIDQALEVCDRNRDLPPELQFAWTLPGWPMSQIMADWPGQTAERKQRIEQALKEGRFVVHGLPFTTHTELLEPEDLVRGLGFASQVSRAVSIALPRDAKMTDVPCHSWIMPTLLRHAGIEFLHLGCNAASRSPQVPLLFWWEGPDGSRLLTMYAADGYGTGLAPPENWPYRSWLALIHTGDNHGPPKPEEVSQLLAEAKVKLPGIRVRIGRLSDFADAIVAENAEIPTVRGDMPDSWIHGPLCNPQGAQVARNMRPLIGATESLNTLLPLWGETVDDAAPTIAAAYEKSLLYGEHTWGGALAWVSSYDRPLAMSYGDVWQQQRAAGKFARLEASWAEHTAYIEAARDLVRPALERQLQTLAEAVRVEGERIVVFNPLPWQRDGLVSLPWKGPQPLALRAVDGDAILPLVAGEDGIQFVARDLPGLGYRTYVATDAPAPDNALNCDTQRHTLSGPHFTVEIDPARGVIRALTDKRTGRQWVDSSAPQAFGQYLYERFDRNQVAAYVKAYVKIDAAWALNELGKPDLPPAAEVPYQALTPTSCQVRYEQSPIAVSAVIESAPNAQLRQALTTRITLYRDLPCVDLALTLHDKPADSWPEAGWICLPVRATKPQFRLGRLGSIVDPTRDLVPGSNHNLYGLNTGLAVIDEGGDGLGICALDSPLVSLDQPGCWKYDPVFMPQRSHVYVNLFNNQWTTNFRFWNEGTWTSRVRLWPLENANADQSMTVTALEARYPLLAAATSAAAGAAAGALPAAQAGISVSRKGVLVSALGGNVDGHGTVLRLWELAGQSGACTVHVPGDLASQSVRRVDLRGQATPESETPQPADGGQAITLKPFAPVSLLFERQGSPVSDQPSQ